MKASPKSAMERVRNRTGRADWFVSALLKEGVRRTNDPALKAAYAVSKNEIDDLLKQVAGPKTKIGRKVKQVIQTGRSVLQEMAAQ
jgi:hypothetical protein